MKKIPTLFKRDENDRRYVTTEVMPGCEWVMNGEGVATRKFDGTCVFRNLSGQWYARREVKMGKTAPAGWVGVDTDTITGKAVGWEPAEQSSFIKYLAEALFPATVENSTGWKPGTYELCGPKINGNPEDFDQHVLVPHGLFQIDAPRTYEGLREYLDLHEWEGLVYHHPDGRRAKIKRKDFI